MPFCVNCGSEYNPPLSICESCYLDPVILEENIDRRLRLLSVSNYVDNANFSYPGERASLACSIFILAGISIVLSTISFGVFLGLIVLALVNIKVTSIRTRGTMVQASKDNLPHLYRLMKLVCYRLKVPMLPLYIRQDDNYNAYTMGFLNDAWVVVNSGILNDFTPDELAFVLGHEVAHVKRRHTTWLTLMSPASQNIASSLLGGLVQIIFNFWSLKCEHTADRGGLLAVRDEKAVIMALLKVFTGNKICTHIDWEKLVQEHEQQDNILVKATELLGSHPLPAKRISEVYKFRKSRKYHLCVNAE